MDGGIAGDHARVEFHDAARSPVGKAAAAEVEEERGLRFRLADGEVAVDGGGRFRAEGHLPLLLPFAAHANPALAEIEIVEIQADQLADAQSAAVEQFEDGHVARRERTFELRCGYAV